MKPDLMTRHAALPPTQPSPSIIPK